MKKLLVLVLVLILSVVAAAETITIDWSSMTDEEIAQQIEAAQAEQSRRSGEAEMTESEADAYPTLEKGSKGDAVVELQNRLNDLGYTVGKADGDYGNKTVKAIETFQGNNGLDVTGIADDATQQVLFSDNAKHAPASGSGVSQEEPAQKGGFIDGWYISDDGLFALKPMYLQENYKGSYTLFLQLRDEKTKDIPSEFSLNISEPDSELILSKEKTIQDFVCDSKGHYSFKVSCGVKLGTATITRIQSFSITVQ